MLYIQIFLAGITIMLVSLSGVLFMWHGLRDMMQKNLKFLVTLAIGVFGATLFLMVQKTTHLNIDITTTLIVAIIGAFTLEILQRLVPESHHHHGADENECCDHASITKINPRRVLLGDAAHNIGDGIMLVPAFFINLHVGLSVTFGIILHEIVQEISEFFILKEAGYSTKRALLSNLLVSTTIFIGIGISLFVATATEYSHLLIAFSIGALLYIIVRDLLPHTLERIKHEGNITTHIIMLILGAGLMLLSASFIPHT